MHIMSLYKNENGHQMVTRGLLSGSSLSCTFCTATANQWIGDESMFSDCPYTYSAESLDFLEVVQLKKIHINVLQKDCIEFLAEKAKNKLIWLKQRILSINRTTTNILKKEEDNKIFQVALNNINTIYPIAKETTLQKLRMKRFAHIRPTKKVFK